MPSIYNKIIKNILDKVFPKYCLFCQTSKLLLCENCEQQLAINSSPLPSWIQTRYSYEDENVRKIIFKIKYNHTPDLGTEIGAYCAPHININNSILVPIPISKQRQNKRGYNQALYISRGISDTATIDILERVRDTQKLFTTKHRDNRATEIKDSFAVKDEYREYVKNKNIILIDDITTTGATLFEARNTLLKAGAQSIRAFTIAH